MIPLPKVRKWGKQLDQHHPSTQMSKMKTKMLPGHHRSLKEAAGVPWSIHVKDISWYGEFTTEAFSWA